MVSPSCWHAADAQYTHSVTANTMPGPQSISRRVSDTLLLDTVEEWRTRAQHERAVCSVKL